MGILAALVAVLALVGFLVRPDGVSESALVETARSGREPDKRGAESEEPRTESRHRGDEAIAALEPALDSPCDAVEAPDAVVETEIAWPARATGDSAPMELALWTGTLRLSSGSAAAGIDGFELRERDRGESLALACDEHGLFSARVAPGSYQATLALDSRELDLGMVELESGALERDLFVPGVTLTGRVNWFPATADSTRPRPEARVLVRRASDGGDAEPIRALATSNGYVVVGLERGTYLVSAESLELLGAGERGCEVDVDGTRDTIVLDLIVSED